MQVYNGDLYTTVGNCREHIPGVIQCYNNNSFLGAIPIKSNHLLSFAIFDQTDKFICYVKSRGQTNNAKQATYLDDSASVEIWNLPDGYKVGPCKEMQLISNTVAKEVTYH